VKSIQIRLGIESCKDYRMVETITRLESNSDATPTERGIARKQEPSPFLRRVLIVDDDPDITLAFKVGLDGYYYKNRRRFEVYTYNNPLVALSEFKPNFYDLLLTDFNMLHMNGFELSQKILELDSNIRVCLMSAADVNMEALREVYPEVSFGSFIKKPVEIEYLAQRMLAELNQ
jgi:DNA-binding NtrC family response regulator